MQTYDSYKDSGEQWLGKIPSHWEVKRLNSYFVERRAKVSDKDYAPLSVTKSGVFPQLENVAKSNDGDNRKLVCKGDFVINSRSDRKGSSGISPMDGSVSLINIVLAPRKGISSAFCNYLLKMHNFIEEFYRNGHGIVADLWTTKYDEMKMIKLAIPPFDEQEAMVAYLDRETAKIDAAIARQQRMIELLQERKQIIIQNAVTKGLNPDVPMKDSGIDYLGQIPQHWSVYSLKKHITFFNGYAFDSSEFLTEGEMPVVRIGDITGNAVALDNVVYVQKKDFLTPYETKEEDIVIAMSGATTGKIGVVHNLHGYINQRVGIIRSDIQNYIMYCLQIPLFANYITLSSMGSAQPNISSKSIKNFKIALPPAPQELDNICRYLNDSIPKIDRVISNITTQISLLRERKQIIINEVVTGKIKVV